jgi:outer membrane protein OmpA-like peptidoglycan-associated protein
VYDCAADACGGYDFRFATRVVAEPAMHVDLADYRFVAAERQGPNGPEAISLIVSRSALAGFVQVIEVGAVLSGSGAATHGPDVTAPTAPLVAADLPGTGNDLGNQLTDTGHVVLEDVVFASGASVLADGDILSLGVLADWLKEDGGRVVVLVGHTDASGNLAANVELGAKRAEAIRARLIGPLGVPAEQVGSEGAGYLSPRASNLTEEGRRLNRRVEVVLLPPAP